MLVRHVLDYKVREHQLPMPRWEDEKPRIAMAFGRKTIADASHAPKIGYAWVHTLDGSPPDPNFERMMACTMDGSSK
jgi:hypothetical protein